MASAACAGSTGKTAGPNKSEVEMIEPMMLLLTSCCQMGDGSFMDIFAPTGSAW